jgi:hypothetical protein
MLGRQPAPDPWQTAMRLNEKMHLFFAYKEIRLGEEIPPRPNECPLSDER